MPELRERFEAWWRTVEWYGSDTYNCWHKEAFWECWLSAQNIPHAWVNGKITITEATHAGVPTDGNPADDRQVPRGD